MWATPVPSAHAQTAQLDPDDAVLLQAQVGHLSLGHPIGGFSIGDNVCLDLDDVIETFDLAMRILEDRRTASGWAFEESRVIAIDRNSGKVHYDGAYETIPSSAIYDNGSRWCVLSDSLGLWLGVKFTVDRYNSVLAVESATALPIENTYARRKAAARTRQRDDADNAGDELPAVSLPYRAWRAPALDANMRFDIIRDDNQDISLHPGYELFGAGELAYFSTQARLVSDQEAMPQSLRLRLYRARADEPLLGPLAASEVSFGDVSSYSSSLVARTMSGRGLALTNRPLGERTSLDKTSFSGTLPVGWDAELYHNGELIKVLRSNGDGRYQFDDVDLRFGRNLFEIIRYGPQGQVRKETKTIMIGGQATPPDVGWWWLSMMQANHDLFEFRNTPSGITGRDGWRINAGMEYGLDEGASVGAALHGLGPRRYAEMSLRGSVAGMLAEGSYAQDLSAGSSFRLGLLGQFWGANFSIESILNRGLLSDRLDPGVHSNFPVDAQVPEDLGCPAFHG